MELVDGFECHVIESKDKQALWIDANAGCAMRYRESYSAVRAEPVQAWPLATRYWFRDLKLVDQTVWLPAIVDIIVYQPAELWNHPDRSIVNEASRVALNDGIPDSVFTLSYPPRTTVRDVVGKRFFMVGDGNEEIDLTAG